MLLLYSSSRQSQNSQSDGLYATPGTPSQVKQTPLSQQYKDYGFTSTYFEVGQSRKVAREYVVGPMPVARFLEEYVPQTTRPLNKFDAKMAGKLQTKLKKEHDRDMHVPWVVDWMQKYVGEYHLADVYHHPSDSEGADIAQLCGKVIKHDVVHDKEHLESNGTYQLQNVELVGQFKYKYVFDPFVDADPETIYSDTVQGRHTLSLMTSYAISHMSMQCRTHVFQFLIVKDYARLLRWDRAGVVVTAKIPLKNKSFAEFLWRFAHLGPDGRGWDTTMRKPSKTELEEARPELDKALMKLGENPEKTPNHYAKISLDEGKAYIVHQLFHPNPQSPFGRGTRGYAAYCLRTKRVVFLKSTWRDVCRKAEHEIYGALHKAGVPHIPTVVDFWKVNLPGHVTRAQEAADLEQKTEGGKSLRTLEHYILVLQELCRDVTRFKSPKELLTVLSDAAEAHEQADEKANILHRDISVGNILITDEGGGLLIDWDLAKDRNDAAQEESEGVVGTFQFMAARFTFPVYHLKSEPHNQLDDIESMFHVLQWTILHWAIPKADEMLLCGSQYTRILYDLHLEPSFHLHPLLINLLQEIRKTIATRYMSPRDLKEASMEYESRLEKIPLLKKHLESAGITAETSYLEQIPERLVYRAKLDKRGWLVTALRSAANDPQCPTNDPSEAQIISEKESKLQMDSSVPEYRFPSDEPPQKIRKVNEASKYLQVEAVEMNDASKDDGEGSSSGTKRKTLKS